MPNGELAIDTGQVGGRRDFIAQAQLSSRGLEMGGLLFFIVSLIALAVMIYTLWQARGELSSDVVINIAQEGPALVSYFASKLLVPFFLLLASLFGPAIGYALLRTAGTARREVIPRQDYILLSQILLSNNTTAIDDYIRLSSLTGAVGTFIKVGLSGLPLATIAITMAFSLLSLWTSDEKLSPQFFDLAKLTLGAFIGSFVQRSVSERIASSEQQSRSPTSPPASPPSGTTPR